MKQTALVILLTMGLLAVGFFGCSGCKTKPENVAYRGSKTAHVTATAALAAWGDYVKAHHPPVEQEKKVQAAFDSYKAAQLVLLDATKAYMASGGSTNAPIQQKFEESLAASGAALADLVGLIQQLGVKL